LASGTPTKVELGIDTAAFGGRVILDDDGDTYIEAPTDDTIDFYAGGTKIGTFTATTVGFNDGVEITTADNTDTLTLTSTDADASVGPNLRLYRNSSSPADNDYNGAVQWEWRNDNSQDVIGAEIQSYTRDVTDGTEDNILWFQNMTQGTLTEFLRFDTQSDQATITFNENSNDIDFRVESNGNANMLFVDGGENRVGFGTGTPGRDYQFLTTDQTDVSIIAANNQYAQLLFGDPDDDNIGSIGYNNSSNAMEFHANATQIFTIHSDGVVFNEASNDQNFRVEGNGNTHMLFVDAGDNRVGIKSAPDLGGALHIKTGDSGGTVNGNYDTLVIEESGHSGIEILSGTGSTGLIGFGDSGAALRGYIGYNHSTDAFEFGTAAAERMRIDSDGDVFIGTTSASPNPGIYLNNAGQIAVGNNNGTNGQDFLIFRRNAANIGSVIQNGTTGVTYATTSDYRLKENVNYNFDATTRLKQLKPSRFNFITEPDRTVDGFLAHEVSSIVPEAITGVKDETETKEKVVVNASGNVIAEGIEEDDWEIGKSDILWTSDDTETQDVLYTSDDVETQDVLYTEEDELPEGVEVGEVKESATKSVGDVKQEATQTVGDVKTEAIYPSDSTWEASKVIPVYQGIDQSKLVPLLVKTIQELEARITALES
jgi:hypothetical protein